MSLFSRAIRLRVTKQQGDFMSQRLAYSNFTPKALHNLVELGKILKSGTLDAKMIDMVQIRASQMNQCTFCVDMHVKEAKIHGERDIKVHHITVWRESELFSMKERAALEFTEALTQLKPEGISDELYGKVREHFSDQDLVDLTYVIGLINLWNRMNAVFRTPAGALDKLYGLDKAGL
jgi:AhpD family alkylhydroperoxidase